MESKQFPYALFFGHLALKKLLKAIVAKASQEHAQYTHSLPCLASEVNIEILDSFIDKLAEYTEFHQESRYPHERKDFYKKCTEEFSRRKYWEMAGFINVLTAKGICVEKAMLYGSYASGNIHARSDLDLIIVFPDFGKGRFEKRKMLFQIAWRIDSRIETILISSESYEKDTWLL